MITVIIATHNGGRTLGTTLSAFLEIKIPEEGMEIIVVNNASTDQTPKIASEFLSLLPMSLIQESRPGKSFALNRGISVAKGDLIVFTDDDVVPDENWLKSLSEAAQNHQNVSLFSGQVRNYWEHTPPQWLMQLAEDGRSFGATPNHVRDGAISVAHVKGCNLMVRKHVCSKVTFSEDSGKNFTGQATSIGGEDTDFVERALTFGYELHHVSKAVNRHIVRKEQIGLLPVMKRYFRIGRAAAYRQSRAKQTNIPLLFGYPRHLYKRVPLDISVAIWNWMKGNRYDAANRLVDTALACGRQHETKKIKNRGV